MQQKHPHIILFFLLSVLFLSTSCSLTKTLAPDEYLYTGADYAFRGDSAQSYRTSFLQNQLERVQLQKPNRKVFGLPARLWMYNLFATEKEKGLWHNLQQKLGQPPVILDSVSVVRNRQRMEQQLFNVGHFNARVSPTVKTRKKQKASIQYDINLSPAYLIDTISYALPHAALREIATEKERSKAIRTGKPYRLSVLRDELERIETRMQEKGYFYFQSKYLKWQADTLSRVQDHRIWLQLSLLDDVPRRALSVQRIGNIKVFANTRNNTTQPADTFQYADVRFIAEDLQVKPSVIYNNILLRLLDRYSPGRQLNTLERLSQINYFRFVNLRFAELTKLDSLLEMNIYLTPREQHTLEGSVGLSFNPGTFWGPEFSVSYTNRNFLGGAEELSVRASGLFNIPLPRAVIQQEFQETDIEVAMVSPGIQIPFSENRQRARLRRASTRYRLALERERLSIPLGNFAATIADLQLIDLQETLSQDSSASSAIRFNQFGASVEYTWQRQPRITNSFRPLDFSFQDVRLQEPQFATLLTSVLGDFGNQNFILQLQDILSVQPSYTFRYDTRSKDVRKQDFLYEGTVGYGFSWVFPEFGDLTRINNQFIRLENDVRYYLQIQEKHTLATRVNINTIRSRKNNIALPILDFFRIGGPSSLRGFRPRSLGPGTLPPQQDQSFGLLSGQGELLLESSLEYRFRATSLVELATFIDAGNVWLVTGQLSNEDTQFDIDNFTSEIAVNTGLGLRLHFGFLMLRLDLAFPLAKPWLPAGERWVGDDIRLGLPDWRRENLVFNLAFGYPF